MTWQLYQADFVLRSPLHIGERKIGTNLQITRRYVPARNLWAALTERLTRTGFCPVEATQGDYASVGEWVQQHMAFSYGFVVEDESQPHLDWTTPDFERHYLASQLSTAIAPRSNSAEDESLHEVEYISPRQLDTAQPTCLRSWMFLDEEALPIFDDSTHKLDLEELWLGGERRYGFGHVQRKQWQRANKLGEYEVDLNKVRPIVHIPCGKPALAHVLAEGASNVLRGELEIVLGRETQKPDQFGQKLTTPNLCFAPNAHAQKDLSLKVGFDRFSELIVSS